MISLKPTYFFFVLLAVAISFSACFFKNAVDRETLIKYVNNEHHGTIKQELSSGVVYKLIYKPVDLIIEQTLRGNKHYQADSLRKSYDDCLYFTLSISANNQDIFGGMSSRFESLLKEVSFGLKERITLKENKSDTVFYLSDFIYPRLYGSSNSTNVLLCFKHKDIEHIEDFTVYLEDFVNESPEHLKFKFKKTDLEKVPSLNISSK